MSSKERLRRRRPTSGAYEESPRLSYQLQQSSAAAAAFPRFDSMIHHDVQSNSHLPRLNAYSKGIKVQDLQPPPTRTHQWPNKPQIPQRRPSVAETVSTSSSPSAPSGGCSLQTTSPFAAVMPRRSSEPFPSTPERSEEDAATSRLSELCMDIIQSGKEGTSPPRRAEIKEVVAQYHQSRRQAISPRDPNFTEIPSEYSAVLTYGLARSQTVQRSNAATELRQTVANVLAPGSRSKFAEIKHTLK